MPPWTNLLLRQTPESGPVTWDEVLAGYDFSLLEPQDVLAWARTLPDDGEALARLKTLGTGPLVDVEVHLWAACAEATGHTPRPGHRRWARAQDRWRIALLREALDTASTPEDLGHAVAGIYDQVGCPEDMLPLWTHRAPWDRRPPLPRVEAILAFVAHRTVGLGLAV